MNCWNLRFLFNGKPEAKVIINKNIDACGLRLSAVACGLPLNVMALVIAAAVMVSPVAAQPTDAPVELASPKQIDDYLKNYCVACHGPTGKSIPPSSRIWTKTCSNSRWPCSASCLGPMAVCWSHPGYQVPDISEEKGTGSC